MTKVCKWYRTVLFCKSITQSLFSNISKQLETNTIRFCFFFFWYFGKKILYLEKLTVMINFHWSGFGFLKNESILALMLSWLDKPWHQELQRSWSWSLAWVTCVNAIKISINQRHKANTLLEDMCCHFLVSFHLQYAMLLLHCKSDADCSGKCNCLNFCRDEKLFQTATPDKQTSAKLNKNKAWGSTNNGNPSSVVW